MKPMKPSAHYLSAVKKACWFSCLILIVVALQLPRIAFCESVTSVAAPVLKWQRGGCYSSWCETGWYSSPAVADLDGDGKMEVIGASYSLFILKGADGSQKNRVELPGGRVWPGVAVTDLDGDGDLEIVAAQGEGYVSVLDKKGNKVWSRRPASNELRGLSLFDLDGDGLLEVIVTGAVSNRANTWVYGHKGALLPGWPQLGNDSGYAWGVFNSNQAVFDFDKDGRGEIVVPSDVHYICAYDLDGVQIPANPMYEGKAWGAVGVWESRSTELRGWGTCAKGDPRSERYRANFAHGAAVIADVDGDGLFEVVTVGNVYDCSQSGYPSRYNGVYIFNRDRSRFNRGGFDWRSGPVNTGAPLSEDYSIIENNQPNPVVADLDGDGKKEILFSSYDGRVHAYWLDKTEHGNWPYSVYSAAEGVFRFASEPIVADLDNDGRAEVIFTSWVQKGANKRGKLHILNYLGNPLREINLPAAFGSADWNGALAAPTLANIDDDPDLELVLNTAHSGICAYDLPGTSSARILWGTGRGNYQRTGTSDPNPLPVVTVAATDPNASEAGPNEGAFTIYRTGNTNNPLKVLYKLLGTASNGKDYKALSGELVIPKGTSSRRIRIIPLQDSTVEGAESVNLKLINQGPYIVGSPGVARVLIQDAK